MTIVIINGPNLNLLGKREPAVYGTHTLWDIETELKKKFPNVTLEFYQYNSEGDIIDRLHQSMQVDGIILNAGAFTHYSYAIRDAIAAIQVPVIEVHLSNIHAREEFRHRSVLAPVCKGVITGFGVGSYELALQWFINNVK